MQTAPHPAAKDYDALRVLWTRDQCDALERAGVLTYRYELIEGAILRNMSQNMRHARLVREAMFWLAGAFGKQYVLDQITVHVHPADNTINAPQPDVILLNKPDTAIPTAQPRPQDIRLLIEISDSTRSYDLGTKAALYARAGIPEYWAVCVEERVIYVHTAPGADGSYTRRAAGDTETLCPLNAPPAAAVSVADLLP